MDDKKPWESKTLWVNAVAFLAIILQAVTGQEVLGAEAQGSLIVLANVILRLVTKGGVTLS